MVGNLLGVRSPKHLLTSDPRMGIANKKFLRFILDSFGFVTIGVVLVAAHFLIRVGGPGERFA